MEGVQGTGTVPTVTLVLMQACEEAENTGTQHQGNPSVQQGNLEIQQCTMDMQQSNLILQRGSQQDSPDFLQQATPGNVIVQQSSADLQQATSGTQQGSPELQQGGLEMLRASQGTLELAGIRVYYSMVTPGDDELEDESEDPMETSDPRESTASPEELELVLDEEYNSGDNENVTRSCTYPGCPETCVQGAKQRKPWMCKKHRNKMYKDTYKKKKNDQARTCTSGKLDVRHHLQPPQPLCCLGHLQFCTHPKRSHEKAKIILSHTPQVFHHLSLSACGIHRVFILYRVHKAHHNQSIL